MLAAVVPAARADVVYEQAGGTTKGLVVEEHRDRLVITTEQGERMILRSQIEEVFYSEPERNYLYLGNQAVEGGELSAAEGFFQKAVQINPQLEEAQDALQRLHDLQRKVELGIRFQGPLAALEKGWGLSLKAAEPLVSVDKVREDSVVRKAALAEGDGLVALWSSSLAFLPAQQVADQLLGPPRTPLKLTIEREISLPPVSRESRGWPELKLSMERLGLTVQQAPATREPTRSGLLPGDRIVSIDGAPTRYTPLSQARAALEQAKGRGVTLRIHRDLLLVRP